METRISDLLGSIQDDSVDFEGKQVLLAISGDKSLLAANLDHCFVFINILTGTENQVEWSHSYGMETVDKSDLEAFAESIDFGIIDALAET